MMDWRTTDWVFSWFPSPTEWETRKEKPTLKAVMQPLISHMVEILMATEAVAAAPAEPTMAVSIREVRQIKNCSRMAGPDRRRMVSGMLLPRAKALAEDAFWDRFTLCRLILVILSLAGIGHPAWYILAAPVNKKQRCNWCQTMRPWQGRIR